MEGGNDGIGSGVANLLASPAVRNASLACLAVASVILSYRSFSKDERLPPRLPEKDEKYQKHKTTKASTSSSPPAKKNADGLNDIARSQDVSKSINSFSNQKDESRSNSMSSVFTTQTEYNDTLVGGTKGNEQVISGFTKTPIAIFWDMDNCCPNSGASGQEVATKIRRAAQSAGHDRNKIGMITSFKAYLEVSGESAAQMQLRSELQGSGVSLIDTPKSGRKDVADKMMIADLLSYAIDRRPPALIVLLSGDRDFAYPLGILRNRGYDILLITPPIGASPILEASATYKLRWRQDVLGVEFDANGRPYNSSSTAAKITSNGMTGTAVGVQAGGSSASSSPPRSIKPQDTANNTPPVFQPLVTVLETMSEEGDKRPLRSKVSPRLRTLDPKVFEKAQASGWTEYTQIAAAAGIVVLGSGTQTGLEWIALRKNIETDSRSFIPDQVTVNPAAMIETEDGKLEPFFPLIEAYKTLKAGLPSTKEPSARSIADALDAIAERGQFDPYKAAGVKTFDHYIKTAFKARVARLAPGENGPVVEMHPTYATMHTGLIMPSNPSARMLDTATISAPENKQNRFATLLSGTKQENESKSVPLPLPSSKSNAQDISKDRSFEPFNMPSSFYAHQPSNEMINVAFFPLANFLLTRRMEGDFSVPENQVHLSVSKHHKLGKSVQSWRQFKGYLQSAIEEKIVTIIDTRDHEYKYLRLHDRLTKGAESGKHLGFQKGHNSAYNKANEPKEENNHQESIVPPTGSRNMPNKLIRDEKEAYQDHVRPIIEQPSAQFNTIPSSPADRQKFRMIIEILVTMRKEAIERAKNANGKEEKEIIRAGMEPAQIKVATNLIEEDQKKSGDSKQQQQLTPAAWLQMYGFNSFSDLFNEAEQKGFVHLFLRENKRCLRLSEKYEQMFFPDSVSKKN